MFTGLDAPTWLGDRVTAAAVPEALLAPRHVVIGADVATRAAAFDLIGVLVRQQQRGPSAREVADRLMRRDARSSTALGHGVALPHAHVTRLRKPVAVYLRLRRPVPFDAPDGRPVTDLLALLVPRPATAAHLDLLSTLMRRLADRRFRSALMQCDHADAVCELFWRGAPD